MRLLAMAGAPARRDSTAIYNCSYQPVDSIDSFCEALLISMAGCGVGYLGREPLRRDFPAHPAPARPGRRAAHRRGLGPGLGGRAQARACKPGSRAATSSSTSTRSVPPARRCAPRAAAPLARRRCDDARVHPRARAGPPGHAPAADRCPRHHVHGRQRRRRGGVRRTAMISPVRLRRSRDAPVQERRLRARQQPALERQQLRGLAGARARPDPGHRTGPGHGQIPARRARHFQPPEPRSTCIPSAASAPAIRSTAPIRAAKSFCASTSSAICRSPSRAPTTRSKR